MTGANLPAALCAIDTTAAAMTGDVMMPFAFDEVYGRRTGDGGLEPAVHLWRHERAFVLGTRDWRLPRAQEAVRWLQRHGYSVAVRNSGGAAVPLDPGVVNLSLIVPNRQGDLDAQRHFVLMAELIGRCLERWSLQIGTGEVRGSYCPGDFDVSVQGKKLCGIAQRRLTRAVIIQAFVIVEGSGEERGRLVQAFYEQAAAPSSQAGADHPIVEPASMTSLSELVGEASAASFVDAVKQELATHLSGEYRSYSALDPEDVQKTIDEYRRRYSLHAQERTTS
ncbi:biotin/lipoate A/B protein ligase family protein [Brevibacillus sp. TJ4]|uniref:lipoate--protein ligase family protein n=1 Tax=Brevibacillus sp. TJ4 TaxID=3234853 RepID=UPI0037D91307